MGWGEEAVTRVGKDLRLADKQLAVILSNPIITHKARAGPSISTYPSSCSSVTVFLGKAIPAGHFHSMMSKGAHSGASQVWVHVTAPWHTCCLCRLPSFSDGEAGVSHLQTVHDKDPLKNHWEDQTTQVLTCIMFNNE